MDNFMQSEQAVSVNGADYRMVMIGGKKKA
jgi:hypothetical protein